MMTEHNSTLDTIYKNWAAYQALIVKALEPLSEEQLALRVAPHMRSAGQIARHMVGARVAWFYRVMGEGDDEIAALAAWNRRATPEHSAAELVAGLETTGRLIHDSLARWTTADMEHVFRGVHNGEEYADVRQWIIWHLIEHDLHHGGEFSLTLGMHGLAAPDL
jgi:uncharacterized damage-inducible protein DinB